MSYPHMFLLKLWVMKVLIWSVFYYHGMIAHIDRRQNGKRVVASGFHSKKSHQAPDYEIYNNQWGSYPTLRFYLVLHMCSFVWKQTTLFHCILLSALDFPWVQKSTEFQSEAMFHPRLAFKIFEILVICLSVCQSRSKKRIFNHFKSFSIVKNHI